MNIDELCQDELDALTRTAPTRRVWIGEEVCQDCFEGYNICFGYHRKGICAKCGRESLIYEILPG